MDPYFQDFYHKPSQSGHTLAISKHNLPDFFDSNMGLLKRYHPNVFKMLSELTPFPAGEVINSFSGKPNLRMPSKEGSMVYLHDLTDPEVETSHFLSMVPENSTGVVFLVGMGLGYTTSVLLKERVSMRNLVVFDLHSGVFVQAMHVMDLSQVLSDSRLVFCIGSDPEVEKTLAGIASAMRLEGIHVLKHLTSIKTDKTKYKKLLDRIYSCANNYKAVGAGVEDFGKEFLKNRFPNLTSIYHQYLLEDIKDKFKGVPAILVAGGPSLDKNIRTLKEAKDKAVIIAVDTVLPALLAQGVSPDFLTSIDPEGYTHDKFADVIPQIKNISLVCPAWVSPKVSKTFPENRVFWTFTGNKIESWINYLLGGKITTAGANTTAHLNFITASLLGCSPIIFMGQDFAFSNGKDHASHAFFTNKRAVDEFLREERDVIWVDGFQDGKVATNRVFFNMKVQLEQMIQHKKGIFINATEGGAHIEGTEQMTLQDALQNYCKNHHGISAFLNHFIQNTAHRSIETLLSEFGNMRIKIDELKKTIKQADEKAFDFRKKMELHQKNKARFKSMTELPKYMQEELFTIDACHKSLDGNLQIWQLLEEFTIGGLRESDRLQHLISLLEGDPDKYMQWLTKSLERLDAINEVRFRVLTEFQFHLINIIEYHKKEQNLLSLIHKDDQAESHKIKLAELYLSSGDVALAKNILMDLPTALPLSAETIYYMGCVSAFQGEYENTNHYFAMAEKSNQNFAKKIKQFRKKIGEEYESYLQRLKNDGYDLKNTALKGLRFCRDNKTINNEIKIIADEDLKKIETVLESETVAKAGKKIRTWYRDMEENKNLLKVLNNNTIAKYYLYHGNLLIAEGKPNKALDSFLKANIYSPQSPDLQIFIADAFFADKQFDQGIRHILKAVELDRNYAVYWENMGDNLQGEQRFKDAVIAYEQCFKVLKEKINLLKKIGDCYLKLGYNEAAREAYRQHKLQLRTSSTIATAKRAAL